MPDPDPPIDRAAAELRAFLANRDLACAGCGYNLRGTRKSTCPECGRVLRLGLTGPPAGLHRTWLPILALGIVGAESAGLLINYKGNFYHSNSYGQLFVIATEVVLLTVAIGLVHSLARRRNHPETAWRWAAAGLFLCAGWTVIFVMCFVFGIS